MSRTGAFGHGKPSDIIFIDAAQNIAFGIFLFGKLGVGEEVDNAAGLFGRQFAFHKNPRQYIYQLRIVGGQQFLYHVKGIIYLYLDIVLLGVVF